MIIACAIYLLLGVVGAACIGVMAWLALRLIGFTDPDKVDQVRPNIRRAAACLAASVIVLKVTVICMVASGFEPPADPTATQLLLLILVALPSGILIIMGAWYLQKLPLVVLPYVWRTITRRADTTPES